MEMRFEEVVDARRARRERVGRMDIVDVDVRP